VSESIGYFEFRARERRAWEGLYASELEFRLADDRGDDLAHWKALRRSNKYFQELRFLHEFASGVQLRRKAVKP
jgi:hypothetical protein